MPERGILLRPSELRDCIKVAKENNGNWESINWNRFAFVPVEEKGLVQIRNRCLHRHLCTAQKLCREEYSKNFCDVRIECDGGMIPCHRPVLMACSPLLKELISQNLEEIGTPSPENPISISLPDFKYEDAIRILALFYTGFTQFDPSRVREACELLDFLKVPSDKCKSEIRVPTEVEGKIRKTLVGYAHLDIDSDSESDSEYEPRESRKREGNSDCQSISDQKGKAIATESTERSLKRRKTFNNEAITQGQNKSHQAIDLNNASSGSAAKINDQDHGPNKKAGSEKFDRRNDDSFPTTDWFQDSNEDPNIFEAISENCCYYCKSEFDTEEETIKHCLEECGTSLKSGIKYPEKICLFCKLDGNLLSALKFIYHVKQCYSDPSKMKATIIKPKTSRSSTSNIHKIPTINLKATDRHQPSKIAEGEKVPIGYSRVIMEKLDDKLVTDLISMVKDGDNVVLPPISGYNYVQRL